MTLTMTPRIPKQASLKESQVVPLAASRGLLVVSPTAPRVRLVKLRVPRQVPRTAVTGAAR